MLQFFELDMYMRLRYSKQSIGTSVFVAFLVEDFVVKINNLVSAFLLPWCSYSLIAEMDELM